MPNPGQAVPQQRNMLECGLQSTSFAACRAWTMPWLTVHNQPAAIPVTSTVCAAVPPASSASTQQAHAALPPYPTPSPTAPPRHPVIVIEEVSFISCSECMFTALQHSDNPRCVLPATSKPTSPYYTKVSGAVPNSQATRRVIGVFRNLFQLRIALEVMSSLPAQTSSSLKACPEFLHSG
jgi:hypothetical protein